MSAPRNFEALEVFPSLPDRNGPGYGGDLPPYLIGATIVRFGTVSSSAQLDGGGLVIDYIPKGAKTTWRVVFALNESGMRVTGLCSFRERAGGIST
jgi:hypothetical protein